MTASAAMDELRRHPFALIGTVAALCALLTLGMAFDHAVRQAKDPVALAEEQCGGALGGGPPDVSDCFNAAVSRSPIEAAGWWLVAGSVASALVGFCAVDAMRRRQPVVR